MRIGIIGAGHIGGTLAGSLVALGHEVRVANSRAPETLSDLAADTGATPVWAGHAADDADLVIVSIPQKNVPDLASGIVSTAKPGAPIIETNNYYPQERDGLIAEIEAGTPESVWVSQHLGVPVIKAFNGIFWKHLRDKGSPAGTSGRIALPVAGADGPAKQAVFDLIDQLGFDPIDGGSLEQSWRQQPGTPVYGQNFDVEKTRAALAEASEQRTARFRA